MQQSTIASFIILHLAIVTNLCCCQYVNVNVERKLNLSHAPKYNIEVSFRAVDSTTAPYLIAIPAGVYQKIAYINVSSEGKQIKTTKSSDARPNGYELLSVKYHDLLNIAQVKTQLRLHIEMIFTNVYEYLPKSIQQDENQLVVYTSARVFSSPYTTEKQITIISLASHHIEEVSEDNSFEINGDTVTYGPYYNVKPYIDGYGHGSNGEKDATSAINNKAMEETMYHIPVRLHFENNNPSIYSQHIETEITIGSTTTAHVKTFVEIENHGATLYGGFSRLDYQMRRLDYVGPSFQQLRFQLLKSFGNVKCNDDIGNLTKAYIDYNTSSLMLETRYPIFGGWKSDFTVTYDIQLLTEIIDFSDYNNYRKKKKLKIKFFQPIYNGVVQNLICKITFQNGFNGKNFHTADDSAAVVEKYYMNEYNELVLILSNANKFAGMVYQNHHIINVFYD